MGDGLLATRLLACAEVSAGGVSARSADNANIFSPKNNQFVANNPAAGLGFEPRFQAPKARVLPLDDPAN